MSEDAVDDLGLIKDAIGGDRMAVRRMVTRLLPVVHARVYRACAKGALPKVYQPNDLVQEVWIELLKNEGRQLLAYEPGRGASLEGFVGMITERTIHNVRVQNSAQKRGGHLQEVSSEVLEHSAAAHSSPEETGVAADLAHQLSEHMSDKLPPRGQLVWQYAFSDGRSVDEVAQLMGVNSQVVYNWQHKIRSLARAFLMEQSAAISWFLVAYSAWNYLALPFGSLFL